MIDCYGAGISPEIGEHGIHHCLSRSQGTRYHIVTLDDVILAHDVIGGDLNLSTSGKQQGTHSIQGGEGGRGIVQGGTEDVEQNEIGDGFGPVHGSSEHPDMTYDLVYK